MMFMIIKNYNLMVTLSEFGTSSNYIYFTQALISVGTAPRKYTSSSITRARITSSRKRLSAR